MATLDERRIATEEKLRKINEKIEARNRREKEKEDKRRAHFLIEIGGLVCERLGLKWNQIDPSELSRLLDFSPEEKAGVARDAMTAQEARSAWADLRKSNSDAKKAKRRAVDGTAKSKQPDADGNEAASLPSDGTPPPKYAAASYRPATAATVTPTHPEYPKAIPWLPLTLADGKSAKKWACPECGQTVVSSVSESMARCPECGMSIPFRKPC